MRKYIIRDIITGSGNDSAGSKNASIMFHIDAEIKSYEDLSEVIRLHEPNFRPTIITSNELNNPGIGIIRIGHIQNNFNRTIQSVLLVVNGKEEVPTIIQYLYKELTTEITKYERLQKLNQL